MMKLILIVLIVQFLKGFTGSPVPSDMESPVRFCGQRLAIELSILCKGKYNEARGNEHRLIKRGIVDECCFTTCSRQYLKNNYCGPQPIEQKIKQTTKKPTKEQEKKIKPKKKKIDFLNLFFNLGWGVGEKMGMISVPGDH